MSPLPFQNGLSKDIAIGVLTTLVMFTVSVLMPVVGFFFSLFIPLPVLFYRSKLGRRNGMIVPLVAVGAMFVFLGGFTMDILFFSGLMLLGFVLSEMFEKKLTIEMTIVATCGIVLGAAMAGLLMYSVMTNTGIVALVSGYVAKNLELSLRLYQGIGIPQETIDTISGSLDQIQYVLVRILPSLTAAATLFVAWTNLIAARPILRRRGLSFPDFGRLNLWQAPDALVWGVIGFGVILMLPQTSIRLIGINGLLVLLTVYFIQGIAIVSFYFEKKKLPRAIRVVLYTMIAFQQLLLLVIICIGMFDMWINFRKIDKNKHEPNLPT